MNIIFNKLFKIDIGEDEAEEITTPDGNNDLKEYIIDLLEKIIDNQDKKGFEFESDTTEVKGLIDNIIDVENVAGYLAPCIAIANRLHRKEVDSEKTNNLGVPPVKGILVISLIADEENRKRIIISKADYNEFLDVISYEKRQGFPIKKKVYKAFLANISDGTIQNVAVYDTNSAFTVYWYRDFLELKKVHSDEYNTEEVFKIIETKVLNPIRTKHKADYFEIWNATVRYFRVQDEFDLDHYVTELLDKHKALTDGLDLKPGVSRLRTTIAKSNVDSRFTIKPEVIKKRLKKTISLTPQIDLNIKDGIPDLDRTIKRFKGGNGDKWIMIRSDDGFEYFKDKEIVNNE